MCQNKCILKGSWLELFFRFISTGEDFTDAVIENSALVFRYDTEYGLNDSFVSS